MTHVKLKNPPSNVTTYPNSMRDFLCRELKRRQIANTRYSLRAFARSLDINPSHLSKILRGQIGISEEKFTHFAKVLSVSSSLLAHLKKKEFFLREISKQGEWMERVTKQVDYIKLSLDHSHVISDWYHFAILELTRTEEFKPDIKWIQHKLGLESDEVQAAVDRLFRLKMLIIGENGSWIDNSENASNGTQDLTGDAHRELQKQILLLAIDALEEVSIKRRLQSSITLAINKKDVSKAKQNIVTFQRAFATLLQEEADVKDSVYQLSISFFPLTQDDAEL